MKNSKPSSLSQEILSKSELLASNYSPLVWADHNVQSVDNRPFNLKDRPFMIDILDCEAKDMVAEKCVQIGMSVIGQIRFIHKCAVRGLNSIYFLPTDDLAKTFVNGRFDPLLAENPSLKNMAKELDNVQQKKLGRAFAYFFGLKGLTRAHSTPADHLTLDEYDLIGEKSIEVAHNRLENSPFKETDAFSKPSIPDYGVDRLFGKSDQQHWVTLCEHCNHWNSEDDLFKKFPSCIVAGKLVCLKCGKPLNVRDGEWVATYPTRSKELAGFRISRLMDPLYDPHRLIVDFENALDIGNFFNSRLGRPFADLSFQMTAADILQNICQPRPMAVSGIGCTAGVDVGHKYLCVVISTRGKNCPRDYLWVGTLKGEDSDLWRQLSDLFKRFDVKRYAIDLEPESQSVKDFIRDYRRDGWAVDYIASARDPMWDDKQQLVKVNRTMSLDASHKLLRDRKISLPTRQSDDVQEFAKHCGNLKRQRQVDDKGAVSYTWVHNESDPDHFRHAFNYDALLWMDRLYSTRPMLDNKTPPDIRRTLGLE